MTETTESTETSGGVRIGGILGILGLVAAVSVGAIALGSSTPAGAEGLQRFESCAELDGWVNTVAPQPIAVEDGGVPSTVASEERAVDTDDSGNASSGAGASFGGDAPAAAPLAESGDALASDAAGGGTGGTGDTNTVVEGVDEIDVIDRVGDDRLLVSRNGVLALVDLSGRAIVAELPGIPYDARISVAGDLIWIAGTVFDPMVASEVWRVRIDGDTLVEDGRYTMPGGVMDARRTGDTLHVVAVDYPQAGARPFADGPVPCEQVYRPVAPATDPGATLVTTFSADGPLEPTAAAEITGSSGNLLVTDTSVFVATQTYSGDQVTTGVHRFELNRLNLIGSGAVPGAIAGPFAMNEYEGHLRVATNAGWGFGMPIEGDVLIDTAEGVAVDPAVPETTVAASETDDDAVNALAEVFVLDLDGDLDVVGSTGRFGHDNETIQGVRFVGDTAYVVTFLQTDPFWVIDLADPAAPTVVGELEIPGFSGYLHPVDDGLVVGFGPDGNGQASARLFDVADPQNPSVVDELTLGDDTPATWDHHAFIDLGEDHFAVPFNDYPEYREVTECENPYPSVPEGRPIDPPTTTVPPDAGSGDGSSSSSGSAGVDSVGGVVEPGIAVGEPFPYCPPEAIGGGIGAVELAVTDGQLVEVERAEVSRSDANAERIVKAADGTWLLLSWDRLIPTDGGDDVVLPAGEIG